MVIKTVSLTTQKQEIKLKPAVIVVLAFLCAVLFAINKSFGTKRVVNNWLLVKKQTALSCQPNNKSNNDGQLPAKDNGCSHTGNCSLINSGNKRNKRYTC